MCVLVTNGKEKAAKVCWRPDPGGQRGLMTKQFRLNTQVTGADEFRSGERIIGSSSISVGWPGTEKTRVGKGPAELQEAGAGG